MERDRELEELLDERAISRVLFDYCQGVDRKDWPLVRACYFDDAVDSHGAFVGSPDELVPWLQRRHERVSSSTHFLSNLSFRIDKVRGLARVESYILSLQIVDATAGDPFAGESDSPVFTQIMSRYVDTFAERPEHGWRILRRDVVFDWSRRCSLEDFMEVDASWPRARRDQRDLLYAEWPGDPAAPVPTSAREGSVAGTQHFR